MRSPALAFSVQRSNYLARSGTRSGIVLPRSACRAVDGDHSLGCRSIHAELEDRGIFWRGVPGSERLCARKFENDHSRRIPAPFNHVRWSGTERLASIFFENRTKFLPVLFGDILIVPIDLEERIRRHG